MTRGLRHFALAVLVFGSVGYIHHRFFREHMLLTIPGRDGLTVSVYQRGAEPFWENIVTFEAAANGRSRSGVLVAIDRLNSDFEFASYYTSQQWLNDRVLCFARPESPVVNGSITIANETGQAIEYLVLHTSDRRHLILGLEAGESEVIPVEIQPDLPYAWTRGETASGGRISVSAEPRAFMREKNATHCRIELQ